MVETQTKDAKDSGSSVVEDFKAPKEWNMDLNEAGGLDDYRFCNYKTLTFSNLLDDGKVLKVA